MQPGPASHTSFWQWFQVNGRRLRAAMYGDDDQARQAASAEMRKAVAAVRPGLILEFGPTPTEDLRELIVSADGKRELVDVVKDFVAAAPALQGWNVVAFRPRLSIHDDIAIVLQGEEVKPADVWFRVAPGEDGVDLTLYVEGLTRANKRVRGLGASLLAEHAVGERDALTLLGSLNVEPLPGDPAEAGLRPFRELVGVLDAVKVEKYPPPGSLPLPAEGAWQGGRGTVNGAPAIVQLNAALRPLAGHPAYDRRLTVTIPFNGARGDGMPATEEEYDAVEGIGTRVGEALGQGQESLFAVAMRTRGRRELILYTADADSALRRLEELRQAIQTHRLEGSVERDTFWGAYRAFVRGSRPAGEARPKEGARPRRKPADEN